MNLNAFIYSLFILSKIVYSKLSDKCTKSSTRWNSVKYQYVNILGVPKQGPTTMSCGHHFSVSTDSCCQSETVAEMASLSEIKLKEFAQDKIEHLLTLFSNDSYILLNIYLHNLESTKETLHELFSATYGYNYKTHRQFFYDWFDKLKLYMEGKTHKINQLLDNFFLEMAQRIVRILISPNASPEIIACHTNRLIESKPYQDTDVQLKTKIIRSYPPARLMANAIAVGRDVFEQLMTKTQPSKTCTEKYNSVFHCMLCDGLMTRPCVNSCTKIAENCFGAFTLSDFKRFDKSFRKYMKALIQLAARLDNSFNFPQVNHKMSVQISSAIMNIQTAYPNIKDQIVSKCRDARNPPSKRKKRQVSNEIYDWQIAAKPPNAKSWWETNLDKNVNQNQNENQNRLDQRSLDALDGKVKDILSPQARKIKQKYQITENYFQSILTDLCPKSSEMTVGSECWNGTNVVKSSSGNEKPPKKTEKTPKKFDDDLVKTSTERLNEITKRISSFLTNKNSDPDTMPVKEYKLYKPQVKNKLLEPKKSSNPRIYSSGDSERLPFPVENPKVKSQETPIVITTVKPTKEQNSWQLPIGGDGSGNSDDSAETTTESTIKTTTKTVLNQKTTSTAKTTTKAAVKPNELPDDEDITLPPTPVENISKTKSVGSSKTKLPAINNEGSGDEPENVTKDPINIIPRVPVFVTTTTKLISSTTTPSIEGSGTEFQPKPLGFSPTENPTKAGNPDWDTKAESSGLQPALVPVPVPQTVIPPSPVTEATIKIVPTPSSNIDYPGKIPSEVWLPGLVNVKDVNQRSTPSRGTSNRFIQLSYFITSTMLILLSLILQL